MLTNTRTSYLPGSPDRIGQIYRTCFPVIEAKCRRMFHSSAEAQDVAQEVFARLLESELAARLDVVTAETLLGWIYRVSGRVAIDYVRTRKRRAELLTESLLESEPGSATAEGSVDARRVMAALAQEVPAAELEAAILCRVDRLTHEQSAAVLKTSERTIRRHLSRFDERVAGRKKELLR